MDLRGSQEKNKAEVSAFGSTEENSRTPAKMILAGKSHKITNFNLSIINFIV